MGTQKNNYFYFFGQLKRTVFKNSIKQYYRFYYEAIY